MNKKRRQMIQEIINKLSKTDDPKQYIKDVERIYDEEQDCFDNLSEGLQCTMRGMKMEDAIDNLEEAIDCLEDDDVECAIEYLEDAML